MQQNLPPVLMLSNGSVQALPQLPSLQLLEAEHQSNLCYLKKYIKKDMAPFCLFLSPSQGFGEPFENAP